MIVGDRVWNMLSTHAAFCLALSAIVLICGDQVLENEDTKIPKLVNRSEMLVLGD